MQFTQHVTDLQRHALKRAANGTWDLADRLELAWLNAHVTPHIDDEEWWRESVPNPIGTALMALRIDRSGGRDCETLVHWGFVFPCLACDLAANFEEVLICDVCGGAGHQSGPWFMEPEPTCVITDLDGLVIEEWPDA